MILNYVITILERDRHRDFLSIARKLELPVVLTVMANGTATEEELDLYGLKKTQKTIIMTTADEETAWKLKHQLRRNLFIDIPGNGIMMTLPVKSIGGYRSMAALTNQTTLTKEVPDMEFPYELLLVVANRGYVDEVMEAAKSAGASGGTVIHASNAGAAAGQLLGLHLATEKDVILIVARREIKTAIMNAVMKQTGGDHDADAVVLSLPVSEVAGFRRLET